MRSIFIYLTATLLFFSCKDAVKETPETTSEVVKTEEQTIQTIENPSENGSQVPRLFSNGSELYFSWVSRKDSMDVLNYSMLKDGNWQEATPIIEGNDWFTNWADFPAIAEQNGNILIHLLYLA